MNKIRKHKNTKTIHKKKDNLYEYSLYIHIHIYTGTVCVTVEHILSQKNTMSPMGFDPRTSRPVRHCS
jgi:hypothetical protein